MGASQSSTSLATAAASAHRSGGPGDRRRWAHSFPREPRRDREAPLPLPLPPHCKVLPAAPPPPRLHRTHNGDILHSGGTLTGRRPTAPGQQNGGLIRVRSQSQPRRPDYGNGALFGSEPDLRFTNPQHPHHHNSRPLSRDLRDDSPAKLRISRSRKKYKAPAPPPGTVGADSSSPDSYQWEQHANTPIRRNRLFKTRAETKRANGTGNAVPHADSPSRAVPTLQRSLSSPEFQAELLEVARRLRSSSSTNAAPVVTNGRCSPGGQERERPVGEPAVESRPNSRPHTSASPALRRSQGSGRESTPEPRGHVRENSQPSRTRPSITNHWEILPKPPERREVPSKSFYFGMGAGDTDMTASATEAPTPPPVPEAPAPKQRSSAVRDREVERFAAEIRRTPITSTTLTSGSGSLSSEADQDEDGNVGGIALQLRPTLPKKRLEIPRFSPTAAWRLLSALDSSSLAPPPSLGDAVDALEERITRLARPTAPPPPPQIVAAVAAARGSHDKSGDSGISGDASPVGGHEDSLEPPHGLHNRKGLLNNKPLMAWTPLQDLEGEEESSSDGEGVGAPGSAGPIKFSPRSQLFSLSLPREYSAAEPSSGKTWNALPEEPPLSFHSLRTSRRPGGREEAPVEGEGSTSRPLDGNWLLSRSVPSSLNLQNGGDSWKRRSPQDTDDTFPEARLMKQPSFSYLATGGHVMYLPESAGRRSQLPPRDNRERASSAEATNRKAPRKRATKSCDRITTNDVDLHNEMREIGGSAPGSPQQERPETTTNGLESNPGLRKALERKMRPKKFTFQSTVRQIERRRTAERLSRDAELKEQQRLSELEAMRRVEEEFQRKRAREKANIRHQLRLFSLEESTAFSSLPADWPNGARDDPDGAPAPTAPGSSSHGDTKSPSTQVLSEFRENRRQYREYRPSRTPDCGTEFQSSEPAGRRSMVHPEAVFDIPKSTPVYVATHHTSGGLDERGTSTPRSSSSDNYRRDFAHGALPTGRSLASSDSDMSRPGSRQGPSRVRVLQRSRSASPKGRQETYSTCSGSSVRSISPVRIGSTTNLTERIRESFVSRENTNQKNSGKTNGHQVPQVRQTDSNHVPAPGTEDAANEPPLVIGLQPFGRHSKEYRPVSFRPNSKLAQPVN